MALITISEQVLQNWQLTSPTVELRIAANQAFVTSDNIPIQAAPYYQAVTCLPDLIAKTLTIPEFTINSTQDGIDNNSALYSFSFYTGPGLYGNLLGQYMFGQRLQVFLAPIPSPITFGQIEIANNQQLGAPPFNWTGAVNIGLQALNTPVVLDDGDNQPFVGLRYNLVTNNSLPTNITDFRGAYPGQIISLTINDSHTSLFGAPYPNGTLLYLQYINGGWRFFSASAGISSINGRSDPSQLLTTGNAGTDFNITESGANHIFNLPDAGAAARGVVNTLPQIFNGQKSFSSGIEIGDASNSLVGHIVESLPNDTVAGTDVAKLCRMIAGGKVRTITTAETDGILGPVQSGAGNSGNCRVTVSGFALVTIDGPVTAGNYAVPSAVIAGAVHDAGPDVPSGPLQVVGQFTVDAASGTASMLVLSVGGGGGAGGGFQGICRYNIQDFGATGIAATTTTSGTNASGATTINIGSTAGYATGQGIFIATGGAGGHNYIGTVSSIVSSTSLVVSPALSSTVAGGAKVQHDESAALNAALAALYADGGGAVLFPRGRYKCNGPLDVVCNSIIHFPQITRVSSSPISVVLVGEIVAPLTGSAVLPGNGVIIDSQDFDGTVSDLSAIISNKAYSGTGTVTDTTFNYTQLIIENMTFRNKPNPALSGVQINNGEGLIMRNCLIDAGEALTFTSSGFTVNTQPTNPNAVGITTTGLNNICANYLENVWITGYYAGINVGDNLRFGGGVYIIQCFQGLLCHGNAAMVEGPIGIYLTPNIIVVDNALGTQTTFALSLEVQIINTGAWYDVAANHTIYDPLNIAVGHIIGPMPGNTGYTGCGNLAIFDTYNHKYQYSSTLQSSPQFLINNSSSTSPGNQIVLRNDLGHFGVVSLSGSADTDPDKREKFHFYSYTDFIISGGTGNGTGGVSLRAGGDGSVNENLYLEPFFGIGRSTFRGVVKVPVSQYPPNTPAQITADQNNYAPGVGSFQRWSSNASHNITGLAVGQDGESMEVWNIGGFNIVIKNQDPGSGASARFTTNTGADITLAPNGCLLLRYDTTVGTWRAILG